LQVRPLVDGLRNANFKVQIDTNPGWVVLRVYEHDPSLCQKEIDLMRLVGASVPVPEVIHAESCGLEDFGPFMLMRLVEGIRFRELKSSGDIAALTQAAFSAGETLAAIGRFNFPRVGWLAPGPNVAAPLLAGPNPTPRFIDLCLGSADLQSRMPSDLRDCVHALAWDWAPQLAELDAQAHLVHGDFGKRNLLVRCIRDRWWSVTAVCDWEFAVSGSPLCDIGHFLRYERTSKPFSEPHFSNGFQHGGGVLPKAWRRLARIVDLTALCESLTRDQLPEPVTGELVELVRATVEERDPVFA
jgi:fructokinase